MKWKVLIVEDERSIHKLINAALAGEEYQVIHAYSGDEGIRSAATASPDLIILDLGLPEKTGLEVIEAVREWSQIPIIILSARGDEESKIQALDRGANDYVTKPFSIAELLARIRAFLRTSIRRGLEENSIVRGPFSVDVSAHIVKKDQEELHLTPTEFRLFLLLMRHANRVITHTQLLKDVWGTGFGNDVQYLRVFMKQLRQKIEDIPSQPRYILTDPGIGYRLKIEE